MSQSNYTFGNSFISYHRVILEAGAREPVAVQGQFFRCGEVESLSAKPFHMSFKGDEFFPMQMGLGFRLKDDDYFTKLRFHNPTTERMVIEFWAGAGEVDDSRLNIVRGRPAPVMQADSMITGAEVEIAADGALDLSDVFELGIEDLIPPSTRYTLAHTVITNMDPASDIQLANILNGAPFGTVFPRSAHLVDSSDPVYIYNDTASPIVVKVMLKWWKIEV